MSRDSKNPNMTELHWRLSNFARWIAPEPSKEDEIRHDRPVSIAGLKAVLETLVPTPLVEP